MLTDLRHIVEAGLSMLFMITEESLETYACDEDAEFKRMRSQDEAIGKRNSRISAIRKLLGAPGKREDMSVEDSERFDLVREVIECEGPKIRNRNDNPLQSMVAVPVFSTDLTRKVMTGALLVQSKRHARPFTEADRLIMDSFTVFMALAFDRGKPDLPPVEIALRKAIPNTSSWETFSTPECFAVPGPERNTWLSENISSTDQEIHIKTLFLFFDSLALREHYDITNLLLFNFCHALIGAYRSPADFARAKRRGAFLCRSVASIGVSKMIPTQRFGLLFTILASDLGSTSLSNAWKGPYAALYGTATWLQTHRCGVLLEILSTTDRAILDGKAWSEIWQVVVALVQVTHMGSYSSVLHNRSEKWWPLKLLAIATYLSDFVSMKPDVREMRALCREFMETGNMEAFGLKGDAEGGKPIDVAITVFAPIFEELSNAFPCLALHRQVLNVNIKRGLDGN
jgi:hypothetical protein